MAPCLIVTSTHHRNLLKQQPKMPSTTLPWWQVNVPEDLRTEECPDFLRECGEKDRRIIGTPDSEYRPYGWEEVKDIVSECHRRAVRESRVSDGLGRQRQTGLISL